MPAFITTELLESTLRAHPELVPLWIRDDKRCTECWYIVRRGTKWEVGYSPGGPRHEFEDVVTACAFYIKQDMEQSAAWVRTKLQTD